MVDYLGMIMSMTWSFIKQLGAGVARGAHNPEVGGSKPAVANFFTYPIFVLTSSYR